MLVITGRNLEIIMPVTKGHILKNSIYVRCPEQADLYTKH